MKLTGMVLGFVLIFFLNQARIVSLYFAIRHDKALFELIHGLAGPMAIISLSCLFFTWWISRDAAQAPD